MTTKYDWLDKTLDEYRKVCFMVMENIERNDAVKLMALTNINTKSLIIKKIEERDRALLKELLTEAIDMECYEMARLIKKNMK